MRIFLLLTLLLTFWSCSTTEHSGVTGVGNPSQVSLSGQSGSVVGDTSFTLEGSRSALTIADAKRFYTISSISVDVEYFSWEVDGKDLPENLHKGLIKVGNTLFFEWLSEFDLLNSDADNIDVYLPNTGYKKMTFALSSEEGKRETIHIKGTYTNDSDEKVPFHFGLPFDMDIVFRKKGPAFYLDPDSGNSIEYIFALDSWFQGVDILSLFDVDLTSSKPLTLLAKDFWQSSKKGDIQKIRKNIRTSGVMKINSKEGATFYQ